MPISYDSTALNAQLLATQRNIADIYARSPQPVELNFRPSAASQALDLRTALAASVRDTSASAARAAAGISASPIDPRLFSITPRSIAGVRSEQGLLQTAGGGNLGLILLVLGGAGALWYFRKKSRKSSSRRPKEDPWTSVVDIR